MSSASGTRGGTFIRFRSGTVGASAQHVGYITRERAVVDREQGIILHNMPAEVAAARGYDELRENLAAHAGVREELEIAGHKARGEPRTHYRVTLGFERDVSSDKALGMAREWLEREFPMARGFATVHRDTDQMHVHVWIEARQVDGKKVQLSRRQHRGLDSTWNQIYSREMGRDPREHEVKKEQTREAKRQGWQRQQRPEYPPRTRRGAQEMAPRWEGREVAAQAGRKEREGAAGTFLEQVRAAAGRDFREARSWEELERRLERHGLRVEARGAGMVVTDGRRHVKASSVDREASRPKLEKHFGMSLAERGAQRREYEGVSPSVREVVGDLHGLDRRRWLKEDLARATRDLEAARARVADHQWRGERAEQASRSFDRALAEVYREPAKARQAYDELARAKGADHAAQELRERPEQFGHLQEVEQRRFFGLARTLDATQARERAGNAAELGWEASAAAAALPRPAELSRASAAVRQAEGRVQRLGRMLERGLDRTLSRARIGVSMQRLLPREVNDLQRWITAPHRQLATEMQRAVGKMAPDLVRELVQWVRAPHQQLPTRAIQAFKGLMQDRGIERGSQ